MLQTEYHKVISHPNLKLQKSLASRKNEQPEGNVKYTVLKFYFCFFFSLLYFICIFIIYLDLTRYKIGICGNAIR